MPVQMEMDAKSSEDARQEVEDSQQLDLALHTYKALKQVVVEYQHACKTAGRYLKEFRIVMADKLNAATQQQSDELLALLQRARSGPLNQADSPGKAMRLRLKQIEIEIRSVLDKAQRLETSVAVVYKDNPQPSAISSNVMEHVKTFISDKMQLWSALEKWVTFMASFSRATMAIRCINKAGLADTMSAFNQVIVHWEQRGKSDDVMSLETSTAEEVCIPARQSD